MRILTFKKVYLIHGKQRLEWLWIFKPSFLSWDDVSSYMKYYQLSSEILHYKLILFLPGQLDHDMEKDITVCYKHLNTLRNIRNAVEVLVNSHSTRENVRQ